MTERVESRGQARRKLIGIAILQFVVYVAVSAGVALGVGFSQQSVGWGFAAAFMVIALFMIGSLAVLAKRGQLQNAARVYREAARRSFGRGSPTRRPPN